MVKQELQREQSASMEDYLEAVAMLRGRGKVVRANFPPSLKQLLGGVKMKAG